MYRESHMCVQAICLNVCVCSVWWSVRTQHNKSLVQWDHWMGLSASDVVTVTPTGWEIYQASCQREQIPLVKPLVQVAHGDILNRGKIIKNY